LLLNLSKINWSLALSGDVATRFMLKFKVEI